MKLGPSVRRRLGRFEAPAAEAYRRPFINLDDLASTLSRLGGVGEILEVGAGEGAVGTRLTRAFPDARYLGIDIIDRPGRLFTGDARRAEFRTMRVEHLATDSMFDLVVLVDVLHHVALRERRALLATAAGHVRTGGYLAIKEWERSRSPGQLAWFLVDRYVGGDANVRAFASGELEAMVADVCPGDDVIVEARVPPRRNNLLLVIQRTGGRKASESRER